MKIKLLIFIISLVVLNSIYIKNATEMLAILRKKTKADQEVLEKGIQNTLEFLKHYIFYKIAQDPPQPDFDKSYFPKLDIDNLFKNIQTEDTNYLDFKNEFISAVFKLNDLHTGAFFAQFPVQNYVYICPVSLFTKYDKETNKASMYAVLSFDEAYYNLFKDGAHVVEIIKKNYDTPVESINGKDPFTFIQEFSGTKLRNPHSTYVYHQTAYTQNNFYMPVAEEDLVDFTLVYTNKDTFTTDYIVQDVTKKMDDIVFYENEEENEKFLEYLSDYYENYNSLESNDIFNSFWNLKSFDDIILEFEDKYNIKGRNLFLPPHKTKFKEDPVEWKYTYKSRENNLTVFQCRIDDKNQVNVMKIDNFGSPVDSIPSLEVAEKCALLFDENKFKIVIIFPRNGGGNPIIGYNIIELISPYILTRNSLRIKRDEHMDLFIELYNSLDLFDEYNSSNKLKPDYIKDGFVKETYGDKTEEFSKPFAWRVNQKKIEEIKKGLKNKRKPTEIIIMTDSFAYSSASCFMKNAYKGGAGIIIGYNGNPNLSDDIYDISQSPSTTFGVGNYKNIYPEIYNNTVKYLMGLQSITCMASYHEFQESHIPQEYDVQIVDKRVKLFNPYNDGLYQDFINEAKDMLSYYEKNCNPKNKYLVFFSDECKFETEHLHGGFGCGTDSKWNKTNCVPAYCDEGYYYNRISNSCLRYPYEGNEEEPSNNNWIIIVGIAAGIIVLLAIVLIIMYVKKTLCFKKCGNDISSENLIPD